MQGAEPAHAGRTYGTLTGVNCPICRLALEGGELIMICTSCHKQLGGGLAVNTTGEFRVPTDLIEATEMPERAHAHPVHATHVCSWCGKLEHEVRKLLGRGGLALCDECVALCCDILEAELGGGWRV
ncbi:MAG TPA: ClpX C4-type zinc finger protein [Kofleriaceae bacterium]|nr:ClpX C4-type zinc finger protein [Kofleriaceae bacterium]